ncbi:MAG: hypothetical protein J2P22_07825, partial [Nocardioides sp.]|nr:hypothetical protein [Nocardioides sp.]
MRVRVALVATTLVLGSVGTFGIAAAQDGVPFLGAADLPVPNLQLDCPAVLALGDSGQLSGSLRDASTGDPIGHETLVITRTDEFGQNPITVGSPQTGADGTFHKLSDRPVSRGGQTYEAQFAGSAAYAPASASCTTVVHGTATSIAADQATVGGDIVVGGRLTSADGSPVSGVPITATDAVDDSQATQLDGASTDGDGRFTVTVPDAAGGQHVIDVDYPGDQTLEPATHRFEVAVKHASILTLDPLSGGSAGQDLVVGGRLTTGTGAPVPGATIQATDTVDDQPAADLGSATTGDDGRFQVTVPSAAAGSHRLEFAYLGDDLHESAAQQIDVQLTNGTVLVTDALPARSDAGRDVIVGGRLTDASGDPLAQAEVAATDVVGTGPSTDLAPATTNAEGRFQVTVPGAAAGLHHVDLRYAGDQTNDSATHRVDIQVKHKTTLTLSGPKTLPAQPTDETFEIALTDSTGTPVPGATVEVSDGTDWRRSKETDADGTARLVLQDLTNQVPLKLKVTYPGDETHWNATRQHTWQAVPHYTFTKDQAHYTAGQVAAFSIGTPDRTL